MIERQFTDTDYCLNRQEVAEIFSISLPTVDSWVKRGMPYVRRGSNGREWEFRLSRVFSWWKAEVLPHERRTNLGGTW